MPMKHRLVCAKTATRHFSKALVYDSGNRQWATRVRAMCMRGVDRAEQNKIGTVCIWGGSSPGLSGSLHQERETLYYWERGNNCHSWSPTSPPCSCCPCQAKQTSSCRELCPTCWDSKSSNSDGNSRPDTAPQVRLNDQYWEDWDSIVEGCANQGSKEQSRSWVRVDPDGPDLLVVTMWNRRS
jgi:hypothetical protein